MSMTDKPPLHKRGFFEPRQLESTRKDWRIRGFHTILVCIILGFIINALVQGGLPYAILNQIQH